MNFMDKKNLIGFELYELKRTLKKIFGSFLCDGQGLESGWLTKVRETLYNIYGRIITKKPKGCSYYYNLLNANSKKMAGWRQIKNWKQNLLSLMMNWITTEMSL